MEKNKDFLKKIKNYDDIEELFKTLLWQNCKKCNIKTLHIKKGFYYEVRCLKCGNEHRLKYNESTLLIARLILLGLISFGTYNIIKLLLSL